MARVEGGALWGNVDRATQAHGLATTGGIVSHTGVGGLTLGGGIGWLMRTHGLTVDNLVEAELVTAEGEVIMTSANDHPDLFWALRGGGGNFGVVSAFRFTLHPVGPTVLAGPVFWAAEDTTDVLRFYREFVTDALDALGNVIRVGTILPWPTVNEELHFRPAVTSCYAGPVENGERAVRALREFGTPLVDLVGPTSVAPSPPGRRAPPPPTPVATLPTTSSSRAFGSLASPASTPRPRPCGRVASSKPSNRTAVAASASTSLIRTTTPTEFARPTATTPTGGSLR
jgi:FAD/FMN-containing dehydrogenase